jgi:hypothetical protein
MITLLSFALAVDGVVPVQGRYLDADGAAVDGTRSATFTIWSTESSPSPLWTDDIPVQLEDGSFFALLGADVPLDLSMLGAHPDARFSMQLAGDAPSGRVAIGWAPRAGWASDAGQLGGIAAASYALDTDALPWARITGAPDFAALYRPASAAVPWADISDKPTTFAPSTHTHDASALTGVLPVGLGGTGLSTGPASGGLYLRSSGPGAWSASAIQAADVPGLSGKLDAAGGTVTGNLTLSGAGSLLDIGGNLRVGGGVITQDRLITRVFTGHGAGNVAITHDITVPDEGGQGNIHEVRAYFAHYFDAAYNALQVSVVTTRTTSVQQQMIVNQSSANGGAWSVTKPNNTTLRISKSAGSYTGGGNYWIAVTTTTAIF